MKSEGVEIALNFRMGTLLDRCYCGANITGIIIERDLTGGRSSRGCCVVRVC